MVFGAITTLVIVAEESLLELAAAVQLMLRGSTFGSERLILTKVDPPAGIEEGVEKAISPFDNVSTVITIGDKGAKLVVSEDMKLIKYIPGAVPQGAPR
jgi:hypothetical protein